FLQQQIFRLNVALQTYDPASHSNTRAKLAGVKGLRQIIVGTGVQAPDDHFFIRDGRQQNHVGIGEFAVSDSLADFEAGNIRHQPVRNHNIRSAFGQKVERFAAAPRESDGIILPFQGLFNQLAIDGGVVRHKYGKRRARLAHAAHEARNPLWSRYRQGEQARSVQKDYQRQAEVSAGGKFGSAQKVTIFALRYRSRLINRLRALHFPQEFSEFLLPLRLILARFGFGELRNVHRAELRPAHGAELGFLVKIVG